MFVLLPESQLHTAEDPRHWSPDTAHQHRHTASLEPVGINTQTAPALLTSIL
jgi:hypothetical protein